MQGVGHVGSLCWYAQCMSHGMDRQLTNEQLAHDPALAAARVVESAIQLARAEAGLVLAHGRTLLVRTVSAFLMVILATGAVQITLLLIALSPVAFASETNTTVLLSLVPSVCLSGVGAWLAFVAWRGLGGEPGSAAPRGAA